MPVPSPIARKVVSRQRPISRSMCGISSAVAMYAVRSPWRASSLSGGRPATSSASSRSGSGGATVTSRFRVWHDAGRVGTATAGRCPRSSVRQRRYPVACAASGQFTSRLWGTSLPIRTRIVLPDSLANSQQADGSQARVQYAGKLKRQAVGPLKEDRNHGTLSPKGEPRRRAMPRGVSNAVPLPVQVRHLAGREHGQNSAAVQPLNRPPERSPVPLPRFARFERVHRKHVFLELGYAGEHGVGQNLPIRPDMIQQDRHYEPLGKTMRVIGHDNGRAAHREALQISFVTCEPDIQRIQQGLRELRPRAGVPGAIHTECNFGGTRRRCSTGSSCRDHGRSGCGRMKPRSTGICCGDSRMLPMLRAADYTDMKEA